MLKEIATVSLVLLGFIFIFVLVMQILSAKNIKKSRRRMEDLQEKLKPGAKVMLIGGIYGKLIKLNDDTAIINVSNNVDIKVDRSAIQEVITK